MSSITIKYGKGYDDTWFSASDENPASGSLRDQLIAHFGLDADEVKDLTNHELAVNCTRLAHAVTTAVRATGGKVISRPKADEAQQPSGVTADDVFTAAEAGETLPEEPAVDPTLALIEGASTVEELKAIYAQAQVAKKPLTGQTLDMWKARGKALKAA